MEETNVSQTIRDFIVKRKQELTKKIGFSPTLHSSGRGINSEKEYPQKMKINLDPKCLLRLP